MARRMATWHFAFVALLQVAALPMASALQLAEVHVSPAGEVRTIAAALSLVRAGGRIVVDAGTYKEPLILVNRAVEIVGIDRPVFDGGGTHEIIVIAADSVTIRGLRFININTSYVEDRAAIRVRDAKGCNISDNEMSSVFFGIYLANVNGCHIERNILSAGNSSETKSGNGIHLWSTRNVVIANNAISGFRDGLYFEFVHDAEVRDNLSTKNLRYGLHFMYSDDCVYRRNIFRQNGSGVAVMYTHRVTMIGNHFDQNWGAAAYGLLLKEISDARIEQNVFAHNTTALVADGANRIQAAGNQFLNNGWAVRLDASTVDGRFTANNFIGNTFDVASNSQDPSTQLSGNYWDEYRGYDLDRNGVGDIPFHPVRVFSMIVGQNEPALILLRSAFVTLLDAAERVLPVLTPKLLVDGAPSMRRLP